MKRKLYRHEFMTDWGTIRTAATDDALVLITLPGESRRFYDAEVKKLAAGNETAQDGAMNRQAEKQIRAYLNGKLKTFSLKIDLSGTPFQQKVLRRVSKIGYGQTRTYGEIAQAVGSPKGFRAVGGANACNRLPLVVPCHRVVATTGLGGYAGGLALKEKLLKMEGAL